MVILFVLQILHYEQEIVNSGGLKQLAATAASRSRTEAILRPGQATITQPPHPLGARCSGTIAQHVARHEVDFHECIRGLGYLDFSTGGVRV